MIDTTDRRQCHDNVVPMPNAPGDSKRLSIWLVVSNMGPIVSKSLPPRRPVSHPRPAQRTGNNP